jgi:hypothetical protein
VFELKKLRGLAPDENKPGCPHCTAKKTADLIFYF